MPLEAVFDPAVVRATEMQFLVHHALGNITILKKLQKKKKTRGNTTRRGSCLPGNTGVRYVEDPNQQPPREICSRQEQLACPCFCC